MVMQSVLTETPQSVLHTSIAHVSKPSASGAHTYTQYLVRVSDERSPGLNWTVYRRYSEFRNFRLALEGAIKRGDMCAHCAIMSKRTCFVLFPHRRLFGNLREKTLEARRIGLNAFLDAVAKHARTCRESMTCQTRLLMDKFLMVNDMRYTYLNVDMSEAGADRSSKSSVDEKRMFLGGGLAHRSSSMVSRSDRLSSYSDYRDETVRSCTEEWTSNSSEQWATDSKAGQLQPQVEEPVPVVTTTTKDPRQEEENNQQPEASGLAVSRSTMPNLLAYSKERRTRTHSWNDTPSKSESERSAYKQVPSMATSRHSDPGLARNELLNFTRGSFSGGGHPHRTEGRPRSRKVHLSSAAKRVKKLEEAEARFSVQRKPKCLPRLETIPE
ncbi:hypothetical protein PF008_g1115 [Phytophthora fragariae]|uniref:PX domain-containing protein n=1 Tax=Phytophthora fragariae TaxID=53985 RepID=A0A6G0SLA4_9STRA|nr:hypothetical protein PF008_g1115 [Phytophthora fragariae]